MKVLKRIIPIILVILMLGGTVISAFALPTRADDVIPQTRAVNNPHKDKITMTRVGGYPKIQFIANDQPLFGNFISANDPKLSVNANSVKYGDGAYTKYDYVNIQLAYADQNTVANDYTITDIDAMVLFANEDVEITDIIEGRTSKGSYMLTLVCEKMSFDDIHNVVTAEIAYTKTDKAGTSYRCTGKAEYTFSRVDTPDKPNDDDNSGDDIHFGEDTDPIIDNNNNGEVTPEIKSSTPYIIIEEYSTGGNQQVAAGSSFPLKIICRNTHTRINLDNIIMKVTTSDGLQITNSSNTFYIKNLKKNSSFEKELNISALPNAEAKSHTINISFTYEYVADDARQKGEMSQEISIPVVQQDRFSADPVSEIMETIVGEETYVTAKYVNKSRGDIYNLTATLEADENITCTERTIHKGNVVAGGSSEIEFSIGSTTAGTFEGAIVYTYEDALANIKEVRVPFQVTFQEAPNYDFNPEPVIPADNGIIYDENGNPIDPNAPQGLAKWQIGAIVGGVIVAVTVVAAIVVKKKKAAKEFEDDDENI